MVRSDTRFARRRRRPAWQAPLTLVSRALGQMRQTGVRNATEALDESAVDTSDVEEKLARLSGPNR